MPDVSARRAFFALVALSTINLLNYLDRYLVAGALPSIEKELGINHEQAGLLGTVFIVVYMVASPLGGYFGDRMPRGRLVCVGILLWSLATIASSFAGTFVVLLMARALIGVGEAGYATVAPAWLSDLFSPQKRTRVLSWFYVAMPVGAASGYALGGYFAEHSSWRVAFLVGGIPGLALAVLALFLPDPGRGASEGTVATASPPFRDGLRVLANSPAFWFNTVGQTLMTFSIGGLAYWMPAFLKNERGFPEGQAGVAFGAVTAIAGILGTLAGGWVGDKMEQRRPGGGLWLSGVGLLLAAPFMVLAAKANGAVPIFGAIFLAQLCIFFNSGPLNAAMVNCVAPNFRAFAMGLNVLFIHLLGDAISPPIIGAVGDRSSLEWAIQLNAIPTALGGAVLLWGARFLRSSPPVVQNSPMLK